MQTARTLSPHSRIKAVQPMDNKQPPHGDILGDPWQDWKPVWNTQAPPAKTPTEGRRTSSRAPAIAPIPTVHDHQERQEPTEAVLLRGPDGTRDTVRSQRRIVDARLWEAMTPPQQDAALAIAQAFESVARGLGYRTSDWARIPGGTGDMAAAQSRLLGDYMDWARACQKEKISHAMIMDILVYGHSCRSVDADRRLRRGSARSNLLQGLSVYCRLKGWPG